MITIRIWTLGFPIILQMTSALMLHWSLTAKTLVYSHLTNFIPIIGSSIFYHCMANKFVHPVSTCSSSSFIIINTNSSPSSGFLSSFRCYSFDLDRNKYLWQPETYQNVNDDRWTEIEKWVLFATNETSNRSGQQQLPEGECLTGLMMSLLSPLRG